MGSNRKLLFGVLLVVAGLVFLGLYTAITGIRNQTPPPPPAAATAPTAAPRNVVAYAAQDIPAGSIITKELLDMRKMPGAESTTDLVTNPEAQAVGFITRVAIPKNALIRPEGDFVGHISQTGIAGALRPGTRAMVIPFANKPTLHDLVRIGNFIDINAAFDGQEARTIVPGVRVLAVDVFGNDYPQVNVAVRGPYKAEKQGDGNPPAPQPGANGVIDPAAAPTPTPPPAQAPARPDPAITVEVTPAQANTILLAQASSATIDFVVLPALPGGRTAEVTLVEGSTVPGATPGPNSNIRSVSVTKAQIAPYAERKKAPAPQTPAQALNSTLKTISDIAKSSNNGPRVRERFDVPPLPPVGTGTGTGTGITTTPFEPQPAPPSPTYEIPIYADGKTVRVETVRRPQD